VEDHAAWSKLFGIVTLPVGRPWKLLEYGESVGVLDNSAKPEPMFSVLGFLEHDARGWRFKRSQAGKTAIGNAMGSGSWSRPGRGDYICR